ncbi:MAG: hypothetical protein QW745_00770 [Thermoplasmata archaeon]
MNENIDSKKDSLLGIGIENKTPKRFVTQFGDEHMDCLDASLIECQITIELINGMIITGKLRFIGQYDLILMDNRTVWDVLIMKHGVLTIMGDLSPKQPK